MQVILFVAGAALMPLGIVAIFVGWYGVAHSHYEYDQLTYIVSGGVLGVGLVLLGGFLYFGAWLARMANDQRESARRLADALLVLADCVLARSPAQAGARGGGRRCGRGAGAGRRRVHRPPPRLRPDRAPRRPAHAHRHRDRARHLPGLPPTEWG